MANETLLTNIPALIDEIKAAAMYRLNQHAGILDVVRRVDTAGKPGSTVNFPIFGAVASSDVSEVAEGSDHSTNFQVTNPDKTIATADHVIKTFVSDIALDSTSGDLVGSIAKLFSDGILAKLENDVVGLASGFSNTVCGAGTTMTVAHWYDAIRQIKANGGNIKDLVGVISPKQYWGSKGLRALITDADANSGVIGEEMKSKGFVNNPFGIDLLVSNEINEDVANGGDAAGMIMTRDAIGLHTKNLLNVEMERDASARGFEIVCTGRWGQSELVDDYGIYFLSDVS